MPISRCLLHENDFNSFAEYLEINGWTNKPCKSCYEVIRATKEKQPPLILYKRISSDHATIGWNMKHAQRLVYKFLQSKQEIKEVTTADAKKIRDTSR